MTVDGLLQVAELQRSSLEQVVLHMLQMASGGQDLDWQLTCSELQLGPHGSKVR